MNRLHATFTCKNEVAYNKIIEATTDLDYKNEGLTIWIGDAFKLNKEKLALASDEDYIIESHDDMASPGSIFIGPKKYLEIQSDSGSTWSHEGVTYTADQIKEAIKEYKDNWNEENT